MIEGQMSGPCPDTFSDNNQQISSFWQTNISLTSTSDASHRPKRLIPLALAARTSAGKTENVAILNWLNPPGSTRRGANKVGSFNATASGRKVLT